MPFPDIDGGLTFQGYNPRILTDRLPKEQSVSRPFYLGGSQVPVGLNAPQLSSSGRGFATMTHGAFRPHVKRAIKVPGIRKKF
jgi:hypothetical protein